MAKIPCKNGGTLGKMEEMCRKLGKMELLWKRS
jgi:hypothetical protein